MVSWCDQRWGSRLGWAEDSVKAHRRKTFWWYWGCRWKRWCHRYERGGRNILGKRKSLSKRTKRWVIHIRIGNYYCFNRDARPNVLWWAITYFMWCCAHVCRRESQGYFVKLPPIYHVIEHGSLPIMSGGFLELREGRSLLPASHRRGLCAQTLQSRSTLCDPVDCSPSVSSVHGILQARILDWIAMLFSRGSSRPKDQTCTSCITSRFFTDWATREAHHTGSWGSKLGLQLWPGANGPVHHMSSLNPSLLICPELKRGGDVNSFSIINPSFVVGWWRALGVWAGSFVSNGQVKPTAAAMKVGSPETWLAGCD